MPIPLDYQPPSPTPKPPSPPLSYLLVVGGLLCIVAIFFVFLCGGMTPYVIWRQITHPAALVVYLCSVAVVVLLRLRRKSK